MSCFGSLDAESPGKRCSSLAKVAQARQRHAAPRVLVLCEKTCRHAHASKIGVIELKYIDDQAAVKHGNTRQLHL